MIDSIKEVYKEKRRKIEESFQVIYDQAVRLADKVGSIPCMPCIAIRKQHRSYETAESVFDYFKKNAAIDHIYSGLDEQSSSLAITASSLLGLVPTVICTKQVDIATALELYHEKLPSPELIALELLAGSCDMKRCQQIKGQPHQLLSRTVIQSTSQTLEHFSN